MYPLKKHRDFPTAKAMLDYIEKRTGITLWVGRDHFDYVLFIPAADEDAYQDQKPLFSKVSAGFQNFDKELALFSIKPMGSAGDNVIDGWGRREMAPDRPFLL